jgi:hypothetical protein
MFRDEMTDGPRPLRSLVHDHYFESSAAGTEMRDVFEFSSDSRIVDRLVLTPHFRRLLKARNATIQLAAEGTGWERFLAKYS